MTTTWLTADLHLGHRFVSELRGFADPEDHDEKILASLYQDLDIGDSLWILGDISSGGSAAQDAALAKIWSLAADYDLRLHLVAGNHDGVHPMHRDARRWDAAYRQVFESVQPFARRRINGQRVWLSHFPWHGGGDHTAVDRYDTVRLNDDGTSWLLHGHTHSSESVDRERRMIQVGVDAWEYRPVSIDTVAGIVGAHS